MPHEWGRERNDCFAYILGAAKAQTGKDRGTRIRWSSREQAHRVLKRLGGAEAALDRYFVRIPPAMAMRGDIAGVPDETFGIHPMIIEGELLVGAGDKGNRRLPRRVMTMAWSAVLPPPPRAKRSAKSGAKGGTQ